MGCVLDARHELLGCGRQLLVGAGLLEQFQGLDAGGHRQGVPTEGSRLIHGACRSHHSHDVGAAAVGAHGKSATDHLAHGREVWSDAEMRLGTAVTDPESGHHFVEDEQGTVLFGEFPQTFEEAGFRLNEASVANNGLEDHA